MQVKLLFAAALLISASAAHAQSDKPGMKPETAPGAAEQSATDAGVAKDPGEVQKQQGDTSKMSPGTVGAAPGGDTKSQGK